MKRVPPINRDTKLEAQINSAKWNDSKKTLYTFASPKCLSIIDNGLVKYKMLIDLGAELCLMSREVFDELDIPIDLEVDWTVGASNSQRSRVYGICHDVLITVGGITARCRFFVLENLSQDVILGRPWQRVLRAKHDNQDDSSCYTTVYDEEGNAATFCSVPSNHERNRSRAGNSGEKRGCRLLLGKEQSQ